VTVAGLPWRGPGPERPEDLALPPASMPLRRAGAWRKRWRYVGFFADDLLGCAAQVEVGPARQTFWALWDRGGRRLVERTRLVPPRGGGQVWSESTAGERIDHAPDAGSLLRIESRHPDAGEVSATLRLAGGRWVEAVCPAAGEGYVWTRKRCGGAVAGEVRIGGRRFEIDGRAVEDESAGYHPRHTVWSWSAGAGRAADGRSVAWNLVSGVNDPPERSERAIWLDGEPSEPGPVAFDGLATITFDDGSRLAFTPECERRRAENRLIVRYEYRQPFGSFAGSLPGGVELDGALGVMESHEAWW